MSFLDCKIIHFVPEAKRCHICKIREASLLCDHIIGSSCNTLDWEKSHPLTCDKQLCEHCSTHISGLDICPDCLKKRTIHGTRK